MFEATTLSPIADNDGVRFPDSILVELRGRLVTLAGGLTAEHDVSGVWIAPDGRQFAERMTPYTVALRSWWQLPEFLAIVAWAREAFRQHAMFVRVAGVPEVWPP